MVTKAKRASNNRWDAANMTVVGCKIRRERAEQFKAACAVLGVTQNAILAEAVTSTIERARALQEGQQVPENENP